MPPRLRKHIFGVERRCMHCAVQLCRVPRSKPPWSGGLARPAIQGHRFMFIPVSALVSYEESDCESAMNVTWDVRPPQPFSKHVLVFFDFCQ